MVTLIAYEKCNTCRKARRWLEERGIPYDWRSITEEKPTKEELAQWQQKSGLPLRKLFNTSGQLYRSMDLKKRLAFLEEEEILELLASEGMLVKRPVLLKDDQVLVGFKEEEWAEALGK